MGVKMVLSGEGSDEIFGGYLYFHAAPDKDEFHAETVRRIKNLHLSDCLRANKSTAAWGVEARVPFLDKEFLEVAMAVDPKEKMITKDRIEKYILRKAFDTSDQPEIKPYLPDKILWRQKEQFSDGVGYGWIDALKENAELHVTDEMMKSPRTAWAEDIPDSKEAYWYRTMFDELFPPYCASTVMRWTPTWSKQSDPSGRYVSPSSQDLLEPDANMSPGRSLRMWRSMKRSIDSRARLQVEHLPKYALKRLSDCVMIFPSVKNCVENAMEQCLALEIHRCH